MRQRIFFVFTLVFCAVLLFLDKCINEVDNLNHQDESDGLSDVLTFIPNPSKVKWITNVHTSVQLKARTYNVNIVNT